MSGLSRWDPFAEIANLQRQFFGDDPHALVKGINIPTTDVFVKDNTMTVEAHLPNFQEDNVNISVDDGILTISAEKHEKEEDRDKKYVVRESSSSFYRRVSLPERADIDNVKADLVDGILKINIPLTPLQEPRRILIGGRKKK